MSHGVLDVVALHEQASVGGGRVEREHDGAGAQCGNDRFGDRAEHDIRHGQNDDIGVCDGVSGLGDDATGLANAVLAGGGGLAVENGVGGLDEVVRDAHTHFSTGTDDGDGEGRDGECGCGESACGVSHYFGS